jgi:hypothetical protein
MNGGLAAEVVEGEDAGDDGSEGLGNLGVLGVGDVFDAIDEVAMDGGVEGVFDLGGSAGEEDEATARRDGFYGEAVSLEPRGDVGDLIGRRAEASAVLLGREPVVEVGGAGLLLGFDEGVELGLTGGGGVENEDETVELGFWGDRAAVELGTGLWVRVAGEGDGLGLVDS